MMRLRLGVVLVVAVVAGCGTSSLPAPEVPASTAADPARPAAPGARVVDHFSPAREFPGPVWTRAGQPVSNRELNTIAGPQHCDWQQAVIMHLGWPVPTVSADVTETRQYIRDPLAVIAPAYRDGLRHLPALPGDAADTGYRTSGLELWLAESDPGGVYLRSGSDVERWPRADPPIGCA